MQLTAGRDIEVQALLVGPGGPSRPRLGRACADVGGALATSHDRITAGVERRSYSSYTKQ